MAETMQRFRRPRIRRNQAVSRIDTASAELSQSTHGNPIAGSKRVSRFPNIYSRSSKGFSQLSNALTSKLCSYFRSECSFVLLDRVRELSGTLEVEKVPRPFNRSFN